MIENKNLFQPSPPLELSEQLDKAIEALGLAIKKEDVAFLGNAPPPPPAGTPLVLGSVVSDSISAPAEQDAYVFTLPVSARVYFDTQAVTGNLLWSLAGPAGTLVQDRFFTLAEGQTPPLVPFVNLVPGTYVLTARGQRGRRAPTSSACPTWPPQRR